MVYLFGGGFTSGSAAVTDYGPQYWMDNDITMVLINYRLGPFGFLTTGSEEIPGNMGLFDQRLGLEWVRENIQYFGGDPDQVTLFGESAGSTSVSLHLIHPASQGTQS